MATPSDDFFIQKVILLMTGVPGTVLLRDQITQLYGETRDLNKVAVFIDNFMNQRTSNIQEGVHFIFDNGFSLDLTPQKIDQLTADSLREGIDTWSELFFHLTDEAEINLDQILDNRADAADLFTDILAELNANIDINDPLVDQWIDKVDASALTLQEAKIAARGLIEQLIAAPILINSTPTDDAIDVSVNQNIELTFNETIKAGNGSIEIIGENEDLRIIPITDTSQIAINGTILTINPLQDLSPNSNYHVIIASGVITDLSGNSFGGINDPTLFNFRTIETVPTLQNVFIGFFNAAPGAANLSVLEDALTSGSSINQIAELLGQHQFFIQQILAGKVTTGDQVAELMSHFGLVSGNTDPASADAQAELFFTVQINAGSNYGKIIFDAVSFLSGTHPPEFNEAATLLANKGLVASVYSSSNSSSNLATLQSILSDVTVNGPSSESEALSYLAERGIDFDNTFPLRIGPDNILGTDSNDIFLGPIANIGKLEDGGAADTLEDDDRIDGGAGTDDRALLELGANGSVVMNPEINNVEVLDITSHSGDNLNMSLIAGVQRINSVASTGALSLTNVSNLIDLGLSNTDSAINLDYAADFSSNEDAMNIIISNVDSTVTINSSGSGSLELLNLDLSFENEIDLVGSGLRGVSNLILTGQGSLNLSMSEVNNLATIDASTNSGGITADLTGAVIGFTATGGSGNDDFKVGDGNDNITIAAGGGDDKVTLDSETLINSDSVDGGDGNDELTFNLDSSVISGRISNNISNFEQLNLVLPNNSSNTLDLSGLGFFELFISGTGNLNLLKGSGIGIVDASTLAGSIQLDLSDSKDDLSVKGSAGSDKIIAGLGTDLISGNEGTDTFIFGAGSSGLLFGEDIDTVTDFVSGIDQLNFGLNMFKGIEGLTFRDVGKVASYIDALSEANEEIKSTSLEYIFANNGSDGWVFVDTNFDNVIDLSVQLNGTTAIAATDISGLDPNIFS